MRAIVRAVASSVPEKVVSNEDLAGSLDTSDEWIRSHTGIRSRHVAAPDQAASDLAIDAARGALSRAGIGAEEVDLVLVATASADYIGFPSTACIVQGALGATKAGAMDLTAGCTGFIYGLETARCFVASGAARHVLVIGAEVLSRVVDWEDRNTCVLFGDGAGAALVSADDGRDGRGILRSSLRSDGTGAGLLIRRGGGTRHPFSPGNVEFRETLIRMDGRPVYNFACAVVSEGIPALLAEEGLTVDDAAWIVPHQANVRILEAAAKRARIPMEKFYVNIAEFANTSAASIPIALAEMEDKGLLRRGDLIVTFGFGAGLTYGGNLIRW